ncbi:hypothetical protein J3Q00_00620 [Pseudomonas sp. D2-3]
MLNTKTGNTEVVSSDGVFYFETASGLRPKAGGNLAGQVEAERRIVGAKGAGASLERGLAYDNPSNLVQNRVSEIQSQIPANSQGGEKGTDLFLTHSNCWINKSVPFFR